jgi:hypothetical protein
MGHLTIVKPVKYRDRHIVTDLVGVPIRIARTKTSGVILTLNSSTVVSLFVG